MSSKTTVISTTNVGSAWTEVFNLAMAAPGGEVGPLVLEINSPDGQIHDDPIIRRLVDEELQQQKKFSIRFTSFLIFPPR